jgi:hypothetical protein
MPVFAVVAINYDTLESANYFAALSVSVAETSSRVRACKHARRFFGKIACMQARCFQFADIPQQNLIIKFDFHPPIFLV